MCFILVWQDCITRSGTNLFINVIGSKPFGHNQRVLLAVIFVVQRKIAVPQDLVSHPFDSRVPHLIVKATNICVLLIIL